MLTKKKSYMRESKHKIKLMIMPHKVPTLSPFKSIQRAWIGGNDGKYFQF